MKRPRDSQRAKLYRAERELTDYFSTRVTTRRRVAGGESISSVATGPDSERIETVPEIQAWLDKICRSRWYRSYRLNMPICETELRFQTYHATAPEHIHVRDGRGRRNAGGSRRGITLPRWARCRLVILHEVAHAMQTENPAHGRQFARIFLDLVKRWMGDEPYRLLREAFVRNRVHYRKRRPPGPVPDIFEDV